MSGFFKFDTDPRNVSGEEDGCLPALSFRERVMGFATCFGLAIFIDLLSFGSMVGLLTGNPTRFALTYTLGNILSIIGSGFLMGFKRQIKGMFEKKRWICATIYAVSMIMTLVSAVFLQQPLLTLIFIVTQMTSYVWYIASYIPYGRDCLLGAIKRCGRCFRV